MLSGALGNGPIHLSSPKFMKKMFISLDEVNLIEVKFIEDLKFGCHFYVILMHWMSF